MGCNIYAYPEYRRYGEKTWVSIGKLSLPRHYEMYGLLAGVRGEGPAVVPPRGVPADMAGYAAYSYWLLVGDHDHGVWIRLDQAQAYVAQGFQGRWDAQGRLKEVQDPEWHTPSWLTPNELEEALTWCMEGELLDYRAVLALLRFYEAQGCETRLVFWFDQ